MEIFYLTGITVDELIDRFAAVIEKKTSKIWTPSETGRTEYISRSEVAKLLRISLPTVNDWTKLGWLNSYKIGRRVLYIRKEVDEAVIKTSKLKYKKGLPIKDV
jgi:excisionase family DNA binding protein